MKIKNLFKKYSLKPEKRLGQHFLIDKKAREKIIESADLGPRDIVLEIGPGIGNLTIELAKRAKKVIAVEKDKKMIEILKEVLRDYNNVKVIHGDILKFKLVNSKFEAGNSKQIPNSKFQIPKNYKVVANLPFYLTAPLIRKFLESPETRPLAMILMVQKEVAQRICAKVPKMNLLAVSVQFYSKPEIVSYISKKSFWPQPKVDSAIIKIIPYSDGAGPDQFLGNDPRLRQQFFQIVRSGFFQPRKQIANNLSKVLKLNKKEVRGWLLKNKIKPNQRAETLSLQNWFSLAKSLAKI